MLPMNHVFIGLVEMPKIPSSQRPSNPIHQLLAHIAIQAETDISVFAALV